MASITWETTRCNLCGSDSSAPYLDVQDERVGAIHIVRCTTCQLIYMNPRPTYAAMADLYGETYYAYDGSTSTTYHSLKWRFFRAMAETHGGYSPRKTQTLVTRGFKRLLTWPLYAKFPNVPRYVPGGKLLDVGCANGEYLAYMRELGWDTYGVEVSQRAVTYAQERRGLTNVKAGELASAGYVSDAFDVVTLWYVLEHVHDPLATLREAVRITKSGGVIAVAVPNIGSIVARLTSDSWHGLQPPYHLHFFAPDTVQRYLVQLGLQPTSLTTYTSPHGVAVSAEYMLSKETGISPHKLYHSFRPIEMLALPLTLAVDAFGQGDTMLVWARKT